MEFIGRKEELKYLEQLYNTKPTFVVIYGKRRVGKTELIKQFTKNKLSIYYYIDNKKSLNQINEELQEILKEKNLLEKDITLNTFKATLKYTLKQNIILAIDEFQRIEKIDPTLINSLQEIIDLEKNQAMLIVSGSALGMMKKIFLETKAPLFKRAQLIHNLQDFSFKETCQILEKLNIKSFEEKIKIYALFGGSIFYYDLIEKFDCKNFDEILETLFLSKIAPLKNEIEDWLIEQFGKLNKTYFQILYALSIGKNTKNTITDITEIKETSLSAYLDDLKDLLGVVEYELPINELPHSKKGKYKISHNFFKFWFKYLYKNLNKLELNETNEIKKYINLNFNNDLGHIFENICQEYLIEQNKKSNLPFKIEKIGRYWKKHEEIDRIILNEKEQKIMFVECKYKNNQIGMKTYDELKKKSQNYNFNGKKYYCIISKSGFKNKLIEYAKNNTNILLIDINQIEKEFK